MNGSRLTIRDVELAVAARYALSRDQMRGLETERRVSRPRQIAMFLARELTGQSLPRIGRHFCRDHTTVLYAVRKITALTAADAALAGEVAGCRELLARAVSWQSRVAAEMAERGARTRP